jgi:hypothetical protein
VTVRCGSNAVEDYAESLTDTEALVQALEELPELEGGCEVVIDFLEGSATARGRIVAVDRNGGFLRIPLEQLEGGGFLPLAAAIISRALTPRRQPNGEVTGAAASLESVPKAAEWSLS